MKVGRRSIPLRRVGYTASQEWAKRNGACISGRRRLGKLSLYVYWQRTCNIEDLMWIARRLKPFEGVKSLNDPQSLETQYLHQLNLASGWVKGAWRYPSRMRKALIAIMSNFDVRWPAEIL